MLLPLRAAPRYPTTLLATCALALLACGGGQVSTQDGGSAGAGSPDSGVGAPDAGAARPDAGGLPPDAGAGSLDGGALAGIWHPPTGTTFQLQLTGTIDTTVSATMYDIDLFDVPQSTLDGLHTKGRIVICYFSAGTYENWRSDASSFPSSAIGNPVAGWAGEWWVDTRNSTVRSIMKARMDLAVQKKCDGVDPDNVDGYTNGPGFPLTATTQLDYNRFLAAEAHARGLSVGLKNDVGQVTDLASSFDWALNEECSKYSECATLQPFVQAAKAVFHVEYTSTCPAPISGHSLILKNLNLDAWRAVCP